MEVSDGYLLFLEASVGHAGVSPGARCTPAVRRQQAVEGRMQLSNRHRL